MPRRFGRPGLLGTMARTAVISGTATAVSGNVARRQQDRAAPTQPVSAPQPIPPTPPTTSAPAGSTGDDVIAQLTQLGQMKSAGLLDDAEFAAAKAKLLGL